MPRIRKSGDGGLYFDAKRKLWIGVVDNGYTPEGKRKQVRVTSRSQSTARQKLEAVKGEIKNFGSPLGSQSVTEWGAFWLSGYKYKKPQTYRTYDSLLTTWVLPTIGRKKVNDVRASDLRRIYDSMRTAGKSTSTALKVHTMLSAMFEGARLERLVSTNVAKDIRPPKAAKTTRDTFTPEETLRLLEAAAGLRDGTKWIVSLYAGIRQGERLGATLDSFKGDRFTVKWNLVEGNYEHGCADPKQCLVTKRAAGRSVVRAPGFCPQKRLLVPEGIDVMLLEDRYMLVPPKSGESREFPLPLGLVDLVQRHVDSMTLRPNPHGLLWPAADGYPMSPRADQAEWRELLRIAGVDKPRATTHWARHTAISDLTAAGVPERVTGEIVGHRSPGITGRYQHVSSLDASDAMAKLGARRESTSLTPNNPPDL